MTEHLAGHAPKLDDEKSHPSIQIQRKRSFTLHEKRISETMQLEFIALFDTNVRYD